jgi:hypothetical protein
LGGIQYDIRRSKSEVKGTCASSAATRTQSRTCGQRVH